MGLRTKFNLALLAAIVIGLIVGAVAFHTVAAKNARTQVLENARIMMAAANAIRNYTARELVPLLPLEFHGKFVPETVPAYAAQKNFKDMQADAAGFSYREPALNPTNLSNRAQDWEADIINLFRNDTSRHEVITERDTPVGPTLNLARPLTIQSETCLTCHGTPAAAPAALTRTYGSVNGFGWKLHETIGAQIVSVPMEVPLKLAYGSLVTFLVLLVAIFAVVFIVLNLVLHYFVVTPVKKVTAIADAVSMGGEDVEVYVKPGKDEISSLSTSFNRMRESLKHAMDMIRG